MYSVSIHTAIIGWTELTFACLFFSRLFTVTMNYVWTHMKTCSCIGVLVSTTAFCISNLVLLKCMHLTTKSSEKCIFGLHSLMFNVADEGSGTDSQTMPGVVYSA